MTRQIHLHIDSLTLDGAHADSREAIAAAIERELASRLGTPGAADAISPAEFDRIDGGRLASPDIGTAIGARIGTILTGGDPS